LGFTQSHILIFDEYPRNQNITPGVKRSGRDDAYRSSSETDEAIPPGVCSTYGGTTEGWRILMCRDLREGDISQDPRVDRGGIILTRIFKELDGEEGMDWLDLPQDDGCRAFVNAVINLRIPSNVRNSLAR
jgi:hypothetical protein